METNRPLAGAGYLLSALLVVLPIYDAIARVMPFHLSDARWRFQVLGNMSNVPMVPLFGLFLALVFAWWARDLRTRRSVGAICIVLAVIIAAIGIMFIVDYFGVRDAIPPRFQHVAAIASVTAVIKELLAIVVLALLAVTSFRDADIVVGTTSPTPINR